MSAQDRKSDARNKLLGELERGVATGRVIGSAEGTVEPLTSPQIAAATSMFVDASALSSTLDQQRRMWDALAANTEKIAHAPVADILDKQRKMLEIVSQKNPAIEALEKQERLMKKLAPPRPKNVSRTRP